MESQYRTAPPDGADATVGLCGVVVLPPVYAESVRRRWVVQRG